MAGWMRRRLQRKRQASFPVCAAVVPAAGHAARMGGRDKLLEPLGGQPVLVHTLRALDNCPLIAEIVVVTRPDLIVPLGQLCKDCAFAHVSKLIVGGDTRTESVLAGVREIRSDAALVAIHDGARPFVSQAVLEQAIRKAAACGAAAPAVPVKDTVKQSTGGMVSATLDRSTLFAVQTPQVFQADLIRAALGQALADRAAITDDCSAVERLGIPVALTEGSYTNIKITTPEDLIVGEALLQASEEGAL